MARNKHPEVTVERILDTATKLFWEKGYENTTIQNIISELGDLSKGAIYHHFKSKDEIIYGVIDRMTHTLEVKYQKLSVQKNYNGLEKLKRFFYLTLESPEQEKIVETLPDLLNNPKFLAIQLNSTINAISPQYIEPIIREGIEDGSIKTDYPKELAEVISLLGNIWLNPLVFHTTKEDFYQRCMFFKELLISLNVDIFDDALIARMQHLRGLQKKESENSLP